MDTHGTIGGSKNSFTDCGVSVVDMNGLFNTVSNGGSNTGNSIMANGDTAVLAFRSYKCSDGTYCYTSMLYTYDLNGEIICTLDDASCVLDGEDGRRLIWLDGTGSGSLTLRALTFYKGSASADYGGGVYVKAGSVIIQLCVFSSCNSIENWTLFGYSYGGGGLFVMQDRGTTTVDFYGTSFSGNGANSNNGDDIYRHAGTVTIHNTCPSPYSSGSPTKG